MGRRTQIDGCHKREGTIKSDLCKITIASAIGRNVLYVLRKESVHMKGSTSRVKDARPTRARMVFLKVRATYEPR